MTFRQLQDEMILAPAARFKESQRQSVKYWLNYAQTKLWYSNDWVFRLKQANVTVTAGSNAVTNLPSDFRIVRGLYRTDGTPLRYLEPRRYLNVYQGDPTTVLPEDFTVIDGQMLVGPVSGESAGSYLLFYEKTVAQMVADTDVPSIPGDFHYILVYGAGTLGLVNESDFTWQFWVQQWQDGISQMEQEFLSSSRGQPKSWGSWSDSFRSEAWRT
jgi:hypothetical protein